LNITPELPQIFYFASALVVFAVVLVIAWRYFRPPSQPTSDYTSSIPKRDYSFASFEEVATFDRGQFSTKGQSNEWQDQMRRQGLTLRASQVKEIILVHGTFVGDDPTGFFSALRHLHPAVEKYLASRIRRILKKSTDAMFRDNGNFTAKYCEILESALDIPSRRFTWTSENHHLGRLVAAASLANTVSSRIATYSLTSADRLLLIGHSHAGQLFALLMQLVQKTRLRDQLISVLEEVFPNIDQLKADLSTIRDFKLDFVTMGAPVVYSWPQSGNFRVLHLSNHRGDTHMAGSLRGILHTRDGDYIQQLGILGTDTIAATPNERRLNKILDDIFGSGRDLVTWQANIAKKMRVSPHGQTILVDYRDDSKGLPNFTSSLFGHGIYTRYETMLFNVQLISKTFYA
jgi:hypothetical protein